MKRLMITGLVMVSMVSQSMAGSLMSEKQKLVDHLSDEMGISQQHASSMFDDVSDFYRQLSPVKRAACVTKINQFVGEEQMFIESLKAGTTTFSSYLLNKLKQSYLALDRKGCMSAVMHQVAQESIGEYQQYIQRLSDEAR